MFCRTMRGVMQNIAHLCTRSKSKTWGVNGWKKVDSFFFFFSDSLSNFFVFMAMIGGGVHRCRWSKKDQPPNSICPRRARCIPRRCR